GCGSASSAAWLWTVSWSALIRRSERTRARSSGWLIGLVRKSSAPASSPLTRSSDGSRAVTITTGRSPVSGVSRIRRQTSYPLVPGIPPARTSRPGRGRWADAAAAAARAAGAARRGRFEPVQAGKVEVHQDQRGTELAGEAETVLRRLALRRPVARDLEDVADQLAVLVVVLDDQDQLAGHGL